MRLVLLTLLLAAPGPALAQGAAPGPARKPAVQDSSAAPIVGCASLANYRLLRRETPEASAARLADPKADHLGCAPFPRDRIVALADHVALGGATYDCLALQGSAICHWTAAGAASAPAQSPPPKPAPSNKTRR